MKKFLESHAFEPIIHSQTEDFSVVLCFTVKHGETGIYVTVGKGRYQFDIKH